jgi:SSS family solute:Na+ symporter
MPAEERHMLTELNPLSHLTNLDWFFFFGLVLISFSLLIYSHFRKKKSESFDWLDYLLMGRKLSLPLFVGSLVATWYGGIFGVTRIAFESGVYNFVIQGIFWYLSYFVFAIFLVHRIRKFKAVTLAELVGKLFGPKSEKLAGVFNFFNVVPAVYTISLGLVLQTLLSISFPLACFLSLSLVFLYISWGGFRAIVLTDLLQFFIMFFGVILVVVFSYQQFGGLDYLKLNLPTSHFNLTGQHSLGETLAWGLIAFSTLVDPNFYQRVFAAESFQTAKKGILISIGFWFLFDICTTLGGMYAKAAIPQAPAENAYFLYSLQVLPEGFRGLFLGGIVACVLSTLDSYIFTASNTLLYDILPKGLHLKKRNHLLSHAFVCFLAFALAIAFEGNIKNIWKTLGSYSAACLLFPVVLAQLGKLKLKDNQFLISCLLSAVFVSVWRNIELHGFYRNIDELYVGVLVSGLSCMFFHNTNKSPSTKKLST